MANDSESQEEILQGEDGFQVKGRPGINLEPTQSAAQSHLGTLLKQKIEEVRQAESKNRVVLVTTVGAEFKPENMPYIPGSTHPALLKHDLATLERNAGYQDRSQVPAMYLDQYKLKEIPIDLTPKGATDIESNIDILMAEFEDMTVSQVQPSTISQVQPVTQGKPAEFTMNVHRDKMHHGGIYMPNESRPYRPGA
jgi:hypothetical protein